MGLQTYLESAPRPYRPLPSAPVLESFPPPPEYLRRPVFLVDTSVLYPECLRKTPGPIPKGVTRKQRGGWIVFYAQILSGSRRKFPPGPGERIFTRLLRVSGPVRLPFRLGCIYWRVPGPVPGPTPDRVVPTESNSIYLNYVLLDPGQRNLEQGTDPRTSEPRRLLYPDMSREEGRRGMSRGTRSGRDNRGDVSLS